MALDEDVVLFQELANGEVLVDNGDMHRVRVKTLKLPDKLVRLVEICLIEMVIEEGAKSVGGSHRKGGDVEGVVMIVRLNRPW